MPRESNGFNPETFTSEEVHRARTIYRYLFEMLRPFADDLIKAKSPRVFPDVNDIVGKIFKILESPEEKV